MMKAEKRGPKIGSLHKESFTAKMVTLKIGETIYMEDDVVETGATKIERDVQTRMHRSPVLHDRKFTTKRLYANDRMKSILLIGITRTK